jgi:hypothetical protein
MKTGKTWWLVFNLSVDSSGPAHSRALQDHVQKSSAGLMCCFGAFSGLTGMMLEVRWRCEVRCAEILARREERFAFAVNDLSVLTADLLGKKMDV